jgi:hypothetical protein
MRKRYPDEGQVAARGPNSTAGGSRDVLRARMVSERRVIAEVIELFFAAFVSAYGHE